MLCVPIALQKHGGYFSLSVPGCLLYLVLQIPVAPRAVAKCWTAGPRHWGCLWPTRGRNGVSLEVPPVTAPRMWVSLLSYRQFFLKQSFPYSCIHRQLCVMLEVWICSTLSSCQSSFVFHLCRDSGFAQHHMFHHSWIFHTNPHFTALLCSQKWEIMFLLV